MPKYEISDEAAQALAAVALECEMDERANTLKARTIIEPVFTSIPLSREEAVIGYLRNGNTPLPIVNHRCWCGGLVDLCKPESFSVSRVAGDSANGYEAYHRACV